MIVQLLALGVALGPPLRLARRSPPPAALAIGGDALLRQSEVLEVLSEVEDATLADMAADAQADADLVSLGLVRSVDVEPSLVDVRVAFEVPIEAASAGAADRLRARCEELLRARLDWLAEGSLSFDVTTQAAAEPAPSDLSALQALADNSGLGEASRAQSAAVAGVGEVGHIVAVASCKGGVGKSTTAVNLAYALAAAGERVGIVDLDIHGPSLPTMARPDGGLQLDGEVLLPLEAHGVKLMSMGFINPGAMPLRGAKVTPVVQQLVGRTAWGALDFLIVDMPPGTGDVQLTLAQDFRVSAAVLVTTPQRLSFVDVVKGVEMFDKVDIPTVAVVENMAGLALPVLDAEVDTLAATHGLSAAAVADVRALLARRVPVFGESHVPRLKEMWGIEASFSLPLLPEVAASADGGVPLVVSEPTGEASTAYAEIADAVRREVRALGNVALPALAYLAAEHAIVILREGEGAEQRIAPADLRRRCRSPANQPEAIPDDIYPLDIVPTGNYAVSIRWSDNHMSLLPYASFVAGWS